MPYKKPAKPARTRDAVNPFAHIDARKKAAAAAKKKKEDEAKAQRKQKMASQKKETKQKSWYDYPFDAMKRVGDYMRGK